MTSYNLQPRFVLLPTDLANRTPTRIFKLPLNKRLHFLREFISGSRCIDLAPTSALTAPISLGQYPTFSMTFVPYRLNGPSAGARSGTTCTSPSRRRAPPRCRPGAWCPKACCPCRPSSYPKTREERERCLRLFNVNPRLINPWLINKGCPQLVEIQHFWRNTPQ